MDSTHPSLFSYPLLLCPSVQGCMCEACLREAKSVCVCASAACACDKPVVVVVL